MNSNGRIIEFYKIGKNSVILAEIRPVQCLIKSNDGQVKSTKWMNFDHWVELELLVNKILTSYEERQKLQFPSNQQSEEPSLLNGSSIKIGYSFKKQAKDRCSYLVPRHDAIWTDDEDLSSLSDKGGRYTSLGRCGYRLVLAVSPVESSLPYNKNIEESLYSALDAKQKPSISSYFQKSSKLSRSKGNSKSLHLEVGKFSRQPESRVNNDEKTTSNRSIFDLSSEASQTQDITSDINESNDFSSLNHMSTRRRKQVGGGVSSSGQNTSDIGTVDDSSTAGTDSDSSADELVMPRGSEVRFNYRNELLTQMDDLNCVNFNSETYSKFSPNYTYLRNELLEDNVVIVGDSAKNGKSAMLSNDMENTDLKPLSITFSSYESNGSKPKEEVIGKVSDLFGSNDILGSVCNSQPDEEYNPDSPFILGSPFYFKSPTRGNPSDDNSPALTCPDNFEFKIKNSYAKRRPLGSTTCIRSSPKKEGHKVASNITELSHGAEEVEADEASSQNLPNDGGTESDVSQNLPKKKGRKCKMEKNIKKVKTCKHSSDSSKLEFKHSNDSSDSKLDKMVSKNNCDKRQNGFQAGCKKVPMTYQIMLNNLAETLEMLEKPTEADLLLKLENSDDCDDSSDYKNCNNTSDSYNTSKNEKLFTESKDSPKSKKASFKLNLKDKSQENNKWLCNESNNSDDPVIKSENDKKILKYKAKSKKNRGSCTISDLELPSEQSISKTKDKSKKKNKNWLCDESNNSDNQDIKCENDSKVLKYKAKSKKNRDSNTISDLESPPKQAIRKTKDKSKKKNKNWLCDESNNSDDQDIKCENINKVLKCKTKSKKKRDSCAISDLESPHKQAIHKTKGKKKNKNDLCDESSNSDDQNIISKNVNKVLKYKNKSKKNRDSSAIFDLESPPMQSISKTKGKKKNKNDLYDESNSSDDPDIKCEKGNKVLKCKNKSKRNRDSSAMSDLESPPEQSISETKGKKNNKTDLYDESNSSDDPDIKCIKGNKVLKYQNKSKRNRDSSAISDLESSSKQSVSKTQRDKYAYTHKGKKRKLEASQPTLHQYWNLMDSSNSEQVVHKRRKKLSQECAGNESISNSLASCSDSLMSINNSLDDLFNDSDDSQLTPGEIEELALMEIVINYFTVLSKEDQEKHYENNLEYFLQLKARECYTKRSRLYYSMQRRDIHAEIYVMFIDTDVLDTMVNKWSDIFPELNSDAVSFFFLVILPDLVHKIFFQIPAVKTRPPFNDDELENILFKIALDIKRKKPS